MKWQKWKCVVVRFTSCVVIAIGSIIDIVVGGSRVSYYEQWQHNKMMIMKK